MTPVLVVRFGIAGLTVDRTETFATESLLLINDGALAGGSVAGPCVESALQAGLAG
ncbi:MAG: hypothetical protein HKN91_17050 [Acidimicrobiia bacterium]|nr:hypothetical protein [Acidimicrobiia bacterium]